MPDNVEKNLYHDFTILLLYTPNTQSTHATVPATQTRFGAMASNCLPHRLSAPGYRLCNNPDTNLRLGKPTTSGAASLRPSPYPPHSPLSSRGTWATCRPIPTNTDTWPGSPPASTPYARSNSVSTAPCAPICPRTRRGCRVSSSP